MLSIVVLLVLIQEFQLLLGTQHKYFPACSINKGELKPSAIGTARALASKIYHAKCFQDLLFKYKIPINDFFKIKSLMCFAHRVAYTKVRGLRETRGFLTKAETESLVDIFSDFLTFASKGEDPPINYYGINMSAVEFKKVADLYFMCCKSVTEAPANAAVAVASIKWFMEIIS